MHISTNCLYLLEKLFISAIKSTTFKIDWWRRKHLTKFWFSAFWTHCNWVIFKRLIFRKIISTLLATVMISRQRFLQSIIPSHILAHNIASLKLLIANRKRFFVCKILRNNRKKFDTPTYF